MIPAPDAAVHDVIGYSKLPERVVERQPGSTYSKGIPVR